MLLARTTETTKASPHHAVMSSTAAHAMVIAPTRERRRRRSTRMLASTGNAVMLIAIPTKRMNDNRGTPGGASEECSLVPADAPSANGTMMLAWLMTTEARTRFRRSDGSSSSPTRNMNSTSPIWLTVPSKPRDDVGNKAALMDGASQPRRDGPRTIPARTSAITSG
jgi:hypothetical protein